MGHKRRDKLMFLVWVSFAAGLIWSCDIGNPWGNVEQDPERYFKIDKLTVEPDTAIMGVDTVTVTVSMEFEMNPFTKKEFDESVLKYNWSELYLIDKDKGKTNSKIMRYFIPNDTTEALPVGIQAIVISVNVKDTTTNLRDGNGKDIFLKR